MPKAILRHQDLKATQVYLGKAGEQEAIRRMDTPDFDGNVICPTPASLRALPYLESPSSPLNAHLSDGIGRAT